MSTTTNEETEKKTPYQGKSRTFGLFFCPKCDKQWGSCHSWANMGQQCRECLINVYPKRQWPLTRSNPRPVEGENKEHPQNLCERCKLVGGHCRGSEGLTVLTVEITKGKKKRNNKRTKKSKNTSSSREP